MTRFQAKARGLKRFDGSPCRNGHVGERFTNNGECVDCCRERVARAGGSKRYDKRLKCNGGKTRPVYPRAKRDCAAQIANCLPIDEDSFITVTKSQLMAGK